MSKYIDLNGLKTYDSNIKEYINKELANPDNKHFKSTDKTVTITSSNNPLSSDFSVNIDNNTLQKNSTSGVISVNEDNLTKYTGDNKSIEVTGTGKNKTINLKIDSSDSFLTSTQSGLKSVFSIKKYDGTETDFVSKFGSNAREGYVLLDKNNNEVVSSAKITIYKDSSLLNVKLLHATSAAKPTYTTTNGWADIEESLRTEENLALCFAYQLSSGIINVEAISVGSFLRESEFGDGLQVNNGLVSTKIKSGENYISVDSNGLATTTDLQTAINNAKTTLTEVAKDSTIPESGAPKIIVTKETNSNNYKITGQDLASAKLLNNEVLRAVGIETNIIGAVGLNADGTYMTKSGTNYLNSATDIENEITILDTTLGTIASNLNNITAIPNSTIDTLFE